ncbi:MAG: polymer-forming cytoskeletal protein [Treponema sp.]|nr:polymer-forming cytoskeletal protein [Treponema sp.]
MAFTQDDISINTLIGQGSFVSGDVKINGFIRVDGDVDGNIQTQSNVIIGDKSRVRGNINAASCIIGGIVTGDVTAPKGIKLLSGSVLIGDIVTKSLQIEENVIFNGHCISLKNEEEFNNESKKFMDAQVIRSRVI